MSLAGRTRTLAKLTASTFRQAVRVGDHVFAISTWYRNPLVLLSSRVTSYEPGMDNVLRACFRRRQGAFVDVGANLGQTFLKVLRLDSTRQYVGFEPQPYGPFLIDDFITKNKHAHKIILPIALSDKTGIEKLGVNKADDAAASFVGEYRPEGFYSRYKIVVTMKGDDVFAVLDVPIAVIKIDVEGAELEVIRGLAGTIAKHNPFILFEILPHFLLTTKQEIDEATKVARDRRHAAIERELRGMGYVLFQVRADGVAEVPQIRAEPRKKFDYLAVPASDARMFEAQRI